MSTRVLVNEEYGYKFHVWDFPGTQEELKLEWNQGRIPCMGSWVEFSGQLTLCGDGSSAPSAKEFGGLAHINDEDDTWLVLLPSKERLEHPANKASV